MPDTRQQYGLPFRQLPSATQRDLTPESALQKEIQTGRQGIYNKYNLQYKEARRSAQFIGAAKSQRMQQEIFAKAKQEMLQFNQQAQQQMTQLQNINRLAEQGLITNPDEIKARMTFGTDVAKSMYPTPEKEQTIPEQFGKLDVYSHRISQELENFQIVGGKKPPKLTYGLYGPLMGGVLAAYHGIKGAKRKPELQIYDPTIPKKDPKPDEDIMGVWRKAEPEEIGIYQAWSQEEKDVAARKRELLGQPDITRRTAQPGAGSGFDAGVAGSIRPQRQIKRQLTATELRQHGTREAYEQGKTLGYWN